MVTPQEHGNSMTTMAAGTAATAGTVDRDSIKLLGMRVDRVDMGGAVALVERFVAEGTPHQIVTADASMVVTASDDPEFARIVENCDLVTPDGAGILWATRRLGTPVTAKVSGVDLSARCVELSAEKGWRIFFFGAGPGVAEEAAVPHARPPPRRADRRLPGRLLQAEDESGIVEQIRAARPDILLVALGIPKQEKFIDRHKAALGVPVCIGVGGTLDVFAGAVKRAPVWMQKAGLEWLYRIGSNPRKRISKAKALPSLRPHDAPRPEGPLEARSSKAPPSGRTAAPSAFPAWPRLRPRRAHAAGRGGTYM
jgi:N-acetylglucosaminyldiphosphoundecaprenol N-acetyl-beta-D-mannosaminyltransferase